MNAVNEERVNKDGQFMHVTFLVMALGSTFTHISFEND